VLKIGCEKGKTLSALKGLFVLLGEKLQKGERWKFLV